MEKGVIKMNNHSYNPSVIPLFTQKEFEQQEFLNEIASISSKYNLLENENELINYKERSYLYLIDYAFKLDKKNEKIPIDVENLFFNNLFLKEEINTYLEKKLKNLTKDDSTHFVKDIEIILFILSIGFYKKILNPDFTYNLDSISELFRYYEEKLKNLFENNIQLFSLTFDSYIILIKTFIQLCAINSIDVLRKNQILNLVDLLIETINIVKYTIELDENQLCKINNIQGEYLYYFSHLEEIFIDSSDINKGLEKYLLVLEKQQDGYNLSKNNHFGNESDILETDEFLIFKNFSSIFLLKLLNEFDSLTLNINYFENEYFRKILKIYYNIFILDSVIKIPTTIGDFRNQLISSLLHNYTSKLDFSKKLNYHFVIEDFIFSGEDFYNTNLETIYRILSFAKDIEDFKYCHIVQILTESTKIKNNYHEFFKLAIFNLFIKKINNKDKNLQQIELLEKILVYLLKNSFDFNLTSIYNKLIYKLENLGLKKQNVEEKLSNTVKTEIKYYLLDEDEFELKY